MRLVNIGFGNLLSAERMIAVVSPESAPIKRVIQDARDKGMLIDATYGRRTKSVIVMDSDHVVLSAIHKKAIGSRVNGNEEDISETIEELEERDTVE